MQDLTCTQCGAAFQARRAGAMYCGRSCSNRAQKARITAICKVDGCTTRATAARGLCGTHYGQTLPRDVRHKRVATACEVCGLVTQRRDDDRYKHVCSTTCRTILTWGAERHGPEYTWAVTAVRRAREYGATVIEAFDRLEIFERDDWTCYMCGIECDAQADTCNPRSATVDHVIALSNGGDHSMANARTACLGCNSSKAARDRAA